MVEESRNDKYIIAKTSTCVDPSCNGWLVDSFVGKYWIKCVDSKHEDNNQNQDSKRERITD